MKKVIISFIVLAMAASCADKKSGPATESTTNESGTNVSTITNEATAANPGAATNPERAPKIQFEEKHVQLGTVTEGEGVEAVYKFTNVGNAPLVLTAVEPACGCTVTDDWPKDPIAPGGTGKIKAKFDSKGKTALNTKSIVVKTNCIPPDDIVEIKFSVTVNPKK